MAFIKECSHRVLPNTCKNILHFGKIPNKHDVLYIIKVLPSDALWYRTKTRQYGLKSWICCTLAS